MDHCLESCRECLKQVFDSQLLHGQYNSGFNALCSCIGNLISTSNYIIKKNYENKSDCPYRHLLILQFTQLISALQLLTDIIINEQKINSILKDCRKSVYKRLNFCLDTIGGTIGSNIEDNQSGCFLRWMDNALQKIREVGVDIDNSHIKFREANALFEDILSHSMSIAQICLTEDSKVIKGSSLSVIGALEDLKLEIHKKESNEAMIALFVDICGDKLCALERRVDIAVLKLSLKSFSQYLLPLERIFQFCEENSENVFEQQKFDDIVADFDLHIDRIMQIGLFAVFCSSNIKIGNKIRNCMASLEYLEHELIPVAQMLLSNSSEANQTSASILKNYWIKEANELKFSIYEIIDPSAFCQVVLDAVDLELDILLEKVENNKNFNKCSFDMITEYATVLTDFLFIVIGYENISTKLKGHVKNCFIVVKEIQKAIEVLDNNAEETNSRILKRCQVFKAQLKKLLLAFVEDNETEVLPLKAENNSELVSLGEPNIFENEFLNHIMMRGQNILDNRSILYRTPNKRPILGISGDRKKKEFSMKLQKIHLSFNSSQKDGSFELQDILDNLSKLSSTVIQYD